jgi:hypothetical protein
MFSRARIASFISNQTRVIMELSFMMVVRLISRFCFAPGVALISDGGLEFKLVFGQCAQLSQFGFGQIEQEKTSNRLKKVHRTQNRE